MTAVPVLEWSHDGLPLSACALGLVGRLLETESPGPEAPAEARYLAQYRDSLRLTGFRPGQDPLPRAECDAPLTELAEHLGLHPAEVLATALCSLVEQDMMAGRALAYVQSPVGGSRPTLGLLAAALPGVESGQSVISLLAGGAAVRSGVLALLSENSPLAERALAVDPCTALALAGRDATPPGTRVGVPATSQVVLPESIMHHALRFARALAIPQSRLLVVRCGSSREGASFAQAIANAMRLRPLFIDCEKLHGLGPIILLRRLLPVFSLEMGPGERKVVPEIPGYRGPVICLCGPDGTVSPAGGAALGWSLPIPPREERQRLWTIAVGDPAMAADLARFHRHGCGRIAQIGTVAREWAAVRESRAVTREDVLEASWTAEGAELGALAQPMRERISDDAMVLTPALREELDLLLLRCRERDGLASGLGASLSARYHPGVRALFVGPSGTGKTLAASWLSTRLGVPLYKIDLASVTSKYIGETEKNLSLLFARAERAEVMLLFDEADSLFGKRTDIRDSNDRFANSQTNYLLQRLETFDGIAILTSNNRSRFDTAFVRRLDFIVEFPAPGPEERRALWESHLGTNHTLQFRELNLLSAAADVCGGHIRNAVLVAAVLARRDDRPLAFADVLCGLESELRKLGKQMPVQLRA